MCYSLSNSEKNIMKQFKDSHKKVCHYCNKPINDLVNDLTLDHLFPVSRGGKTIPENLVICRKACNQDKSDFTEEEYIEFKDRISQIKETNLTLKDAQNTYERYSDIIKREKDLHKYMSALGTKISELQTKIRNTNFSSVAGYKLCKELQGLLIQQYQHQTEMEEIKPMADLANKQIKSLQEIITNLTNRYKLIIREEMKIKMYKNNIINLKEVV